MAEAVAIIGLVSSIVQLVDFSSKIVERLNDYRKAGKRIPKTFEKISLDLPLMIDNLKRTKQQADAHEIDDETAKVLLPVVEACLAKTKQLGEVLQNALPMERDSTWRTGKKAFISLANETAVKDITRDLKDHLQTLMHSHILTCPSPGSPNFMHGAGQPSPGSPNFMHGAGQSTPSYTQSQRHPRFMVKFARERNFVGREDIISEIDRRVSDRQPCVAIAGVGGVGKSQVAIEYCYRYKQHHPDAHVFWVHASSHARFVVAYQKIGEELGILDVNSPHVDSIDLVQRWLCHDANGPWLLVLDNADDIDTVFGSRCSDQQYRALFNYLPRSSNGSIIVTTRDRRIGQRLAPLENPITVSTFDFKDAMSLLQKMLSENNSKNENSVALLEALDFLPMAITQAAAFIRENSVSVRDYLGFLQNSDKDAKDLLTKDYHDPTRDPESQNSVFETWKISFNCIRRQKPRAAEILSMMAMLDRQAIPRALLCEEMESDVDFATAIGTLKAFSLITEEEAIGTFGMHRLIQLSTQRWLELEGVTEEWQKKAINVIVPFCTAEFMYRGDWKNWSSMYPHVQAVLNFGLQPELFITERATLLNRLAIYEVEQGSLNLADTWAYQALNVINKLEGDHPKKILIARTVAIVLGWQAKLEAAKQMHLQVMELQKKFYGPSHPNTIQSLAAFAEGLQIQGNYDEAEKLLRELIDVEKASPDPERCQTRFWCQRSLALALETQERYDEAEENYNEGRNSLIRAFGEKHPITTWNLIPQVFALIRKEKYEEAEELAKTILQDNERSLGPHHMSYFNALRCLAAVFQVQGKFEKAETALRRASAGLETIHGLESESTACALTELACSLAAQDKFQDAESTICRISSTLEDISGLEDRWKFVALSRVRCVLDIQGKWEESEQIQRRVLQGFQSLHGPMNLATLHAQVDLATVLHRQEKNHEAELAIREAIRGYEKKWHTENRRTLVALTLLACILIGQDKYGEAEVVSLRAFHGHKLLLGPKHRDTVMLLGNVAYTMRKQDKFEAIESMCLPLLNSYQKEFESNKSVLVSLLDNVAYALAKLGKYKEAEPVRREACKVFEEMYGIECLVTLESHANLASILASQKKYFIAWAIRRRVRVLKAAGSFRENENNQYFPGSKHFIIAFLHWTAWPTTFKQASSEHYKKYYKHAQVTVSYFGRPHIWYTQ